MPRPSFYRTMFSLICLLMLITAQAQISATLLASALNHAVHLDENLVDQLYSDHNVNALYKVAKSMYSAPKAKDDQLNAMQIFHAMADGDAHHIKSMIQLGFAYSENDKSQAIKYFVQAGEDGPDQASLYNAGRLFAEEGNYAPALGYIRAAATLDGAKGERMTDTAKEGYRILSEQLQDRDLSLQEMVDMFPYADLNDFPQDKAAKLWDAAMEKLSHSELEFVVKKLSDLQTGHNEQMSTLQTNLLRRMLVIILRKINDEL